MPRFLLLLPVLSAVIGCAVGAPASNTPSTATAVTPSAAPTAGSSATAAQTPAASAAIHVLGQSGAPITAGNYSSQFVPAFIFGVGDVAALDCMAGDACHGEVQANGDNFLDMVFGSSHGAELMFARLDKVFDPASPSKVIDPPVDFGAWVSALPGLTVLEAPTSLTVGGLPATQLTVRPTRAGDSGVELGPTFGIAGHETRLIGVKVGGQQVVITEQIGEQGVDFGAAVRNLQPIIDSIEWRASATADGVRLGDGGTPLFPGTT
jgi:hypothetical protein